MSFKRTFQLSEKGRATSNIGKGSATENGGHKKGPMKRRIPWDNAFDSDSNQLKYYFLSTCYSNNLHKCKTHKETARKLAKLLNQKNSPFRPYGEMKTSSVQKKLPLLLSDVLLCVEKCADEVTEEDVKKYDDDHFVKPGLLITIEYVEEMEKKQRKKDAAKSMSNKLSIIESDVLTPKNNNQKKRKHSFFQKDDDDEEDGGSSSGGNDSDSNEDGYGSEDGDGNDFELISNAAKTSKNSITMGATTSRSVKKPKADEKLPPSGTSKIANRDQLEDDFLNKVISNHASSTSVVAVPTLIPAEMIEAKFTEKYPEVVTIENLFTLAKISENGKNRYYESSGFSGEDAMNLMLFSVIDFKSNPKFLENFCDRYDSNCRRIKIIELNSKDCGLIKEITFLSSICMQYLMNTCMKKALRPKYLTLLLIINE
jgi:hypothetical protein